MVGSNATRRAGLGGCSGFRLLHISMSSGYGSVGY